MNPATSDPPGAPAAMPVSPLAGRLAPYALRIDVPRLVTAYYTDMPDPAVPAQRVTFGTLGHRGSALTRSFNEWHVLAIRWIEAAANDLLEARLAGVSRVSLSTASNAATTHRYDFLAAYVDDLASVIDMDILRGAPIRLGVDPFGGAGVHYWGAIAERYQLNLAIVS